MLLTHVIYTSWNPCLHVNDSSRVSSYRMAQKYRIIGHFFPKYRTNIGHFSQNIGQNRINMIK